MSEQPNKKVYFTLPSVLEVDSVIEKNEIEDQIREISQLFGIPLINTVNRQTVIGMILRQGISGLLKDQKKTKRQSIRDEIRELTLLRAVLEQDFRALKEGYRLSFDAGEKGLSEYIKVYGEVFKNLWEEYDDPTGEKAETEKTILESIDKIIRRYGTEENTYWSLQESQIKEKFEELELSPGRWTWKSVKERAARQGRSNRFEHFLEWRSYKDPMDIIINQIPDELFDVLRDVSDKTPSTNPWDKKI